MRDPARAACGAAPALDGCLDVLELRPAARPYRQTPADDPRSAPYAGAPTLHSTSAYGPGFTLLSKPVGLTGSATVAAWTFRGAAALAVLAAAFLASRRRAFPAALVGWNPVVAVHFGGGGHNDALMLALVAVALALGDAAARGPAGVAWALAVLQKWVPVLLLPPARPRSTRARPSSRPSRLRGHGAGRPRARDGALAVSLAACVRTAGARCTATHVVRVPSRLHLPTWPFVVAYLGAYAWLLLQAARGRARLGLALALLLLCVPYLIVWYVLWPLVASAYDEDRAAVVLSLALCAYLLPQTIT